MDSINAVLLVFRMGVCLKSFSFLNKIFVAGLLLFIYGYSFCPKCGSCMVKGHGSYRRSLKCYKCKACGRTFNDKTGTIFHYSKLSLRE
jgi:transposase-like protein